MPNFPAFPTLPRTGSTPTAPGSTNATKPRVNTANFGGGYSQRSGDGTNALPRSFTFKTTFLSAADMKVFTDFLEGRKGYMPFMFTVPFEATPRQWICDTWQVEYPYPLHQTMTAQFTENFDP